MANVMGHNATSLSPEAFVAPKSFHEQARAERVPPAARLAARPLSPQTSQRGQLSPFPVSQLV